VSGIWLYVILIVAVVFVVSRIVAIVLRGRRQAIHDDWDSQLVKNLRVAGGNAFTPYEVDFFFTLPDEAACSALRGVLEPEGFAVESRAATGEAVSGFSVAARKHLRVSVGEMQQYSQRFRSLAGQYGGYYDGWMTDPSRTAPAAS
jgi:Regulator of ribonuclease activity B